MRSRAARLTVGAVALIVFGAAAFFVVRSEQQIGQLRGHGRAFDQQVREVTGLLADLRAAQQAYVAAGQGSTFWMPKVAATSDDARKSVAALRETATSADARASLDQGATSLDEFSTVDQRARDYLKSGQDLMAADVVFTEGSQTAAAVARQVETGRLAERQAIDASEADFRKQEALALLGAAIFGALVILLLGALRPSDPATRHIPLGRLASAASPGASASRLGNAGDAGNNDLEYARLLPPVSSARSDVRVNTDERVRSVRPRANAADAVPVRQPAAGQPPPPSAPPATSASRVTSSLLTAAAELCTEFGRVRSSDELNALLGRAAGVLDARGVIVWLGSTSGGDLRPVLAHGYSAQMLQRMPSVSRSANNAAATAYRTGTPQLVLGDPGRASGAVVAPLLSADGCVGALSVETLGGGETSDAIQATVGIFAAQLAGVLAVSAAEMSDSASTGNKAAQG
jgi:hypothetical protein